MLLLPEFVAGCQLQQPPSSWPRSTSDASVVSDDVRSNLRLTHPEAVKHGAPAEAPAKSAQQTKPQLLEMTGRCKSMFNSSCVCTPFCAGSRSPSALAAPMLLWADHGCLWANPSNAHGSTVGPQCLSTKCPSELGGSRTRARISREEHSEPEKLQGSTAFRT